MNEFEQEGGATGFNRRELLKRTAKAGIAASAIASFPFLKPGEASAAMPFKTGFNDGWDFWLDYLNPADKPIMISRLTASGADYIRQNIYWPDFMPDISFGDPNLGPADWVQMGPPGQVQARWNQLTSLRWFAALSDTKVLPCVCSVPAWAQTASGGCKPEYLAVFGKFIAEIAVKFDSTGSGGLEAFEIGNESNADNPAWKMSAEDLAELVTHAWSWLTRYYNEGKLTKPIKVISGGLFAQWKTVAGSGPDSVPLWGSYPNGKAPGALNLNWEQYFLAFKAAVCGEYDVGLHPYDLAQYRPGGTYASHSSMAPYWLPNHIMQIHDQMETLTPKNIWITETGAPMRPPFNASGQATAFQRMMGGFALRPRCKAVIVHRFYCNGIPEPETTPAGGPGPYYKYGVVDTAVAPGSPPVFTVGGTSAAYTTLSTHWN